MKFKNHFTNCKYCRKLVKNRDFCDNTCMGLFKTVGAKP